MHAYVWNCDINYYIVQSSLDDAVVPLNLPYMGILELTLRPAPWQPHVHYAHMYMCVHAHACNHLLLHHHVSTVNMYMYMYIYLHVHVEVSTCVLSACVH